MNGLQRIWVLALVVSATGFGLLWGMRSQPPSETDIINRAAAAYVAETGGAETDCAARPGAMEGVRLVVSCAEGAWIAAYDPLGRRLDVAALAGAGLPGT